MNTPFFLEEATSICNEYKKYIGLPLRLQDNNSPIIECVTITPFDLINKEKFILYYLLFDDHIQAAQALNYKGFLYDIVVIARSANDELEHTDLSSWLSKNQPNFVPNNDIVRQTFVPAMLHGISG